VSPHSLSTLRSEGATCLATPVGEDRGGRGNDGMVGHVNASRGDLVCRIELALVRSGNLLVTTIDRGPVCRA